MNCLISKIKNALCLTIKMHTKLLRTSSLVLCASLSILTLQKEGRTLEVENEYERDVFAHGSLGVAYKDSQDRSKQVLYSFGTISIKPGAEGEIPLCPMPSRVDLKMLWELVQKDGGQNIKFVFRINIASPPHKLMFEDGFSMERAFSDETIKDTQTRYVVTREGKIIRKER